MLLSADRTGTVIMWDVTTGSATLSITTGHTDILMALWVEDSYLFTASLDGRVKVWNAEGEMLHEQGVTNHHNGTLKCPLASAQLLHLLRVRLAALGSSVLPG